MIEFNINGQKLSKIFIRNQYIFRDIDLTLTKGSRLGIIGSNGSGKSTMLKILTAVLRPSSGNIIYRFAGNIIKPEHYSAHYGFVSPYLMLYEEFSPLEHIKVNCRLRNLEYNEQKAKDDLEKVNLSKKHSEPIRTFSSGMKQRMKYVLALMHNPEVLFLDEPTTNLDEDGIEIVHNIIEHHTSQGGALAIATNDEREKLWCNEFIKIA